MSSVHTELDQDFLAEFDTEEQTENTDIQQTVNPEGRVQLTLPQPITVTQQTEQNQSQGERPPQEDRELLAEDIANFIQKSYLTATEGQNEEIRTQNMAKKFIDESIIPQYRTCVTLMQNDNTVKISYGQTLCPTDYQPQDEQTLTAFFDKRRAEVPATFYIPFNDAVETISCRIPTYEAIQQYDNDNGTEKLLPVDTTWEEQRVPYLMEIPVQWAEEIQQKVMYPMQLAHWFKQKESEFDPAETEKVKGLWHWIAAANTRADPANEEGS